jgi:biotin/methionine sulfoxide reductase
MARPLVPHSSRWGAFEAEVADGTVVAIRSYRHDPDPSPLAGNIVDSLRHRAGITQPMVRASRLARGPGPDARRSSAIDLRQVVERDADALMLQAY